jgi:hypothetical protein
MPDKGTSSKPTRKRSSISPELRSRRIQQILFGALAVIIIFSMVLSLVAN